MNTTPPSAAVGPRVKNPATHTGLDGFRGRVRGRVLLLLCAMYFITYVDRVNIATAAPFIKQDLGLSNSELGMVLSAFAIPYAFFQIFGGLLGDRFGPRKVLTVVGIIWAIATAATGFSIGLASLFAARLALGFGEGATFPTATHAMAKWMPPDRRGFAQGITHAASRLGNAVTPLLVAGCIALYDWRLSFWLFGAISLIWVFFWNREFRDSPSDHPKMTQAELDELPREQWKHEHKRVPWRMLLKRILPVTFVDFCYGWSLWVFLTWIPSFFEKSYGLDLKNFALFTTLVLCAGVVGDTLGGMLSDSLLRRTNSLKLARRTNLVVGLLGSLVFIMPVLFIHDLWVAAICLSLSFFFLELTNAVLWAIPMDIAPRHSGVGGGLMNTGFGIAGILSPMLFGFMLDLTSSWTIPFAVSATLLFIGAMVSLGIDPRPMAEEPQQAPA
ncbi:MFS transporter [Pseudomonas kuykendallii]|uniref:Sugar phosphate permease n=1 Tax=Pseudomonas kuykendallii TaxID=1007099 RepID=A0A1H2XQ99_9PSED|nr:MFS transporter [Pseudomonas kuykendallii]MCQ4272623.1 MFS transporter [Pseudomonas kuykendallii]SDW95017.1 Sugar phosphate permease [Pseudomonas kuykendallii]